MPQLLMVFVVGGVICLIGQLMFDIWNLTPAHTMCVLVVAGAVLGGLGIYPLLVDWAGAGASLPISSFGNSLVESALSGARENGFWGIFNNLLKTTSAGISAAIIWGFIAALFFKPKS